MTLFPTLSLWFWALLLAAAVGALLWHERGQRSLLPAAIHRRCLALRFLGLALLALMLLDPAWIQRSPDPNAYQVAILAQQSPSMLTEDMPDGQSRLEWVRSALATDQSNSLRNRLAEQHPLRQFAFSDQLRRSEDGLRPHPGRTAIGHALQQLNQQGPPGGGSWGAIVLFSDGVQQLGPHPAHAARALGEAGIPVHVIGVGMPDSRGTVDVRFAQRQWEGVRGLPSTVEVRVTHSLNRPQQALLSIYEEQDLVATREVTLQPDRDLIERFELEAARAGFRSYRAEICTLETGNRALQALDYATAQIREAARFRVLYIGRPQMEYRFLRMLANEDDQRLELSAWLQLGPERFVLRSGTGNAEQSTPQSGFPEDTDPLPEADTLIVDGAILPQLSVASQEWIRDFVAQSGGGLLVLAPLPDVPDLWRGLLPVRTVERTQPRQNLRLEPVPGPVLRDEDFNLFTRAPAVFLAAEHEAFLVSGQPRGARTALQTANNELPVLVFHAYGAGRSAFQGSTAFWRWRMQSEHGLEQHRRYWFNLLNWLSESRQPRLNAPLQGQVRALEQPVPLQLRVLDNAFRPRSDARVRARIVEPDGTVREVTLLPRFGQPGLFEDELSLTLPGEYRVRFEASIPNGDTLSRDIFFLARSEADLEDTALQEALLRDIARLSGGSYIPWQEAAGLRSLRISDRVPHVERPVHWARSWPFVTLLLLALAADWWLRRRYGLR